jgi:molybdopterin/thiamine biosynthesis adenylyltransferase
MNFITNEHLTRQAEIIPSEVLGERITIIGAGAIGGWVALSLAKMGFNNLTVYDDDTVSIENMNCQFYPYKAIGEKKVDSLKKLVKAFANVEIMTFDRRFSSELDNMQSGIVISAVDSMSARKAIWEKHKFCGTTKFIIDPRMGAEKSLMYVMCPTSEKDINSYEKTLYTDENAVQERCTAKATIYTANLLAGQVCKAVKDIVVGKPYTRVSQWDIGNNAVAWWSSENK